MPVARSCKGVQVGVSGAVLLELVHRPKVVAASVLRHPIERPVASLHEFSLRIPDIPNKTREIPYHRVTAAVWIELENHSDIVSASDRRRAVEHLVATSC